jgi:hypothetical protein
MRLWIWLAGSVAALVLVGCEPIAHQTPEPVRPAEVVRIREFVDQAKSNAARDLRDPSSAQFRGLAVGAMGLRRVLCGEVNGKNAFGGYAGFAAFYALEDGGGGLTSRIAKDGWTIQQAERCIAEGRERQGNNGDVDLSSVERELAAIGCGALDYDIMFWAARDAFCKNAAPYDDKNAQSPTGG